VGAAGIAAYAHGIVRIPGLVASQAIHVPVPWIWLFWGILRLETGSQGSRSGRKTRS